jgi:hypothetical protein
VSVAEDLDARTAAERILEHQQCGSHGCPCQASTRRGHGLTHCFIHNDPGPSLNVDVKNERLLVNCQAGSCDQSAIVSQLRDMDLWPAPEERLRLLPSPKPQIVAEYDYYDEHGTMLFQAVRKMPKGFSQRQPDGKGGWIWSVTNPPVRLVPYRLPELVSSDPKRLVFIVEGEKDVDRLRSLGLIATCNPMGAGKWRDNFADYLKDRPVIVVPDNDATGRAHARQVVESVRNVAKSVGWLDLPDVAEHGDVSDWLDAGHAADEFRDLARKAGLPKPRVEAEIVVADAEFHQEGDEYFYVWHEAGVGVKFSQLRHADSSGAIRGFIDVYSVRPDAPNSGSQWWNRIDLTTQADRNRTMEVLRRLTAREGDKHAWEDEINQVYQDCARRYLQPPPSSDLSEEEEDDDDDLDPQYLFDPIALVNQLNLLLADMGSTKSYLMLYLAVCVATGRPSIFGTPRVRGHVAIFDWETDRKATRRRLQLVCRGMGIPVPSGIHYMNMGDAGSIAECGRDMRQEIAKWNAVLAIVDSLTFGAGGDLNSPEISASTIKALGSLGNDVTKIVAAHPPKSSRQPGRNNVEDVSVIGSGLFEFKPRSVYYMKAPPRDKRGDQFTVTVKDRKLNESHANGDVFYEITFDNAEHTVKFARVTQGAIVETSRYEQDGPDGPDRMLHYLATGPHNTIQIAQALSVSEAHVRTWGKRLHDRGTIVKIGGAPEPGKTTVWALRNGHSDEGLPF